jgi:hypothetical protein
VKLRQDELGYISARYESGKLGDTAISNTPGDPGGASYGRFQLSSKTKTLEAFLKVSKFSKAFVGLKPGTQDFNASWFCVTKENPSVFPTEQWKFIYDTKFVPVKLHALKLGIPNSRAVDELLWSIAVQHGGAKKILDIANKSFMDNPESAIIIIMQARINYVMALNSLSRELKLSLANRYKCEQYDLLKLQGK